jgi:hypothetical protein
MNRRALEASGTAMTIILILIGAAVLGALAYNFIMKEKDAGNVESCRASVTATALAKEVGVQVKCSRKEIVFTDESNDEIDKELAEAIYDCIYISGAGKLDWSKNPWIANAGGEPICIICATIEFDPSLQEKLSKKGTDFYSSFYQWMDVNYVKNSRITYLEYISDIIKEGKMYVDINGNYRNGDFEPLNIKNKYALYSVHYTLPFFQKLANHFGVNPNIDITIPFTDTHITTNLELLGPMSYTFLADQDFIGDDCKLIVN